MANSEWKIGDNWFMQNATHIISKYTYNSNGDYKIQLWEKVGSDLTGSICLGSFRTSKEAKNYYATEIEAKKVPSVPDLF